MFSQDSWNVLQELLSGPETQTKSLSADGDVDTDLKTPLPQHLAPRLVSISKIWKGRPLVHSPSLSHMLKLTPSMVLMCVRCIPGVRWITTGLLPEETWIYNSRKWDIFLLENQAEREFDYTAQISVSVSVSVSGDTKTVIMLFGQT